MGACLCSGRFSRDREALGGRLPPRLRCVQAGHGPARGVEHQGTPRCSPTRSSSTLDKRMVLRQLTAEGWVINPGDLAVLSPRRTMRINRFGVYATDEIVIAPEQYDAHVPESDLTLDSAAYREQRRGRADTHAPTLPPTWPWEGALLRKAPASFRCSRAGTWRFRQRPAALPPHSRRSATLRGSPPRPTRRRRPRRQRTIPCSAVDGHTRREPGEVAAQWGGSVTSGRAV
jgi:hypothetical protein